MGCGKLQKEEEGLQVYTQVSELGIQMEGNDIRLR